LKLSIRRLEQWYAKPMWAGREGAVRFFRQMSRSASSELLYFTERGSGPPLLLVHGLMIDGEMFELVVDQFGAHHRVIVPDLRGFGRSRDLPPPYTASQLADDLMRLLHHLGIESTAVLGYSHGGAIAQQLVLDHPRVCERLVLACAYAHNMASFREKIDGHMAPLFVRALGMKRFAKVVVSLGAKQLDKACAEHVEGLMARQDEKLMLVAWKEAMAFDSRGRLGEIRCPTLIIAGSKDIAVPIHHAKMLHDGIVGSRLQIIDGANHAMIWSNPEELVRVAEGFLSG
ncbi:MAG TPA: alpha/beta hydrolase, partial [Acidisarcina sp.]